MDPLTVPSPPPFILIIEDDTMIREAIQEVLQLEGYAVVAAADGREGLRIAQGAVRPSLVLLDLMMPVMNGWEFMQALRLHPDRIPVVVITAAGQDAEVARLQANSILRKPIHLNHLLEIVEKYCGKRNSL